MYIITAIPGACGDIVSAVIDSKDANLSRDGSIRFLPGRQILKYPNVDMNKSPELIAEAATKYKSISSQYPRIYSTERQIDNVNTYIGIKITDDYLFDWSISRLKILYNLDFDKERMIDSHTKHVTQADYVVNLHDVLSGNLISVLSTYVPTKLNEGLYKAWLTVVLKKFPYNLV
jgi:hypothetical protein